MLRLSRGWRWPGIVLFFGLVLGISGPAGAAAPELRITPNEVEIGSFFEGAQVDLQGTIPGGEPRPPSTSSVRAGGPGCGCRWGKSGSIMSLPFTWR
jgi:hypothetical protein